MYRSQRNQVMEQKPAIPDTFDAIVSHNIAALVAGVALTYWLIWLRLQG